MYIGVCIGTKPVFVMNGGPNENIVFTTKPTYYICVTGQKEGTVVSAEFVTNPTNVVFDGTQDLAFNLDKFNNFVKVKA
jgi:hypothetical protein